MYILPKLKKINTEVKIHSLQEESKSLNKGDGGKESALLLTAPPLFGFRIWTRAQMGEVDNSDVLNAE